MRINICFVADNNYVKHLMVTIASILKNANIDDELFFYILEDNVSNENKTKIIELNKFKNFDIKFFKIDGNIFKNFPEYKSLPHISKTSYFKFLIADLLKDIDKVIYLDCDIIVLSSLKDLFLENINDYYLAGVKDIGDYYSKQYFFDDNSEIYINSGVMLLNLKLLRQDKIQEQLFYILIKYQKEFIFFDQDTINYVCKNKIKNIDYKWNLQTSAFEINSLLYNQYKKQIKQAIVNPNIIHYVSYRKPWKSYIPLRKYYIKYANLTFFKQQNIFNLKIFISFIKYYLRDLYFIFRFLLSPIIKGYKKDNYIKIKIFNCFEFNLYKYK